MNRRDFVQHSLGWLAILDISSCAQYHPVSAYTTSIEIVSGLLISEDGKTLVVVTNRFHFIFDVPSPVVQAIMGTFHRYVQASFSKINFENRDSVSGTISLLVLKAPAEAVEAAATAGFTKTSNGAVFTTTLHGDVYGAADVVLPAQYKLNKAYEIEVVTAGTAWRATPIASTAGGFALGSLILVSLPIALVSVPFGGAHH